MLLRLIKFTQLAIMLVTIAFSSKFKFRNSFKELQFSTYREYNKQLEQKRDLDNDSGNLKITNLDRLIFTKNGEFTI